MKKTLTKWWIKLNEHRKVIIHKKNKGYNNTIFIKLCNCNKINNNI